ncbi:MAG TPA: thioredoxin family protein [Polyangiaceae bacterium]|nr:thioredoxin family protein [Polyangiaceae bacterium]
MRTVFLAVVSAMFVGHVAGCAGAPPPAPGAPSSPHGTLSEMSRVEGEIVLCEHKVPAKVCTRHHPELVSQFKRAGDWCKPHGVPESQCLTCHPDLTFEPLPKLGPGADVAWLAKAGEDVPDLDAHAVKGKATVFEFYADWCAVCRKVDGHVYKRLAGGDAKLAYRKLNVVAWESPLAEHYVRDVPSLPFLVVYGADGKKLAELHGGDLGALDRAIDQAERR